MTKLAFRRGNRTRVARREIEQASDSSLVIEVRVPGTGRDGGPTCGTVKQFSGWMLSNK